MLKKKKNMNTALKSSSSFSSRTEVILSFGKSWNYAQEVVSKDKSESK